MSFAEEIASYQLMDAEAMKEIRYHQRLARHFIEYLADRYRNGEALEVAGLCDEKLDRSGRLLGEVRESARKQNTTIGTPNV